MRRWQWQLLLFPLSPPGPFPGRDPSQLFQSYQLALCRSPWPFLGRYVCTFQKNNWTIWQLMGGTSAICWNKGGQLLVTGSLGERSKIVIVIQKNLLPIVCLQYSSKLIPTNQHLDSEENKPKLNKKTILPNKRRELAKKSQAEGSLVPQPTCYQSQMGTLSSRGWR